jgi:hypothetical protein
VPSFVSLLPEVKNPEKKKEVLVCFVLPVDNFPFENLWPVVKIPASLASRDH